MGLIITPSAPIDTPAFTGTPTAPTAAAATNTTQLATTAFVIGEKYSPYISGIGALGSVIKAVPIMLQTPTAGKVLSNATLYFIAVNLYVPATLLGVKVIITVAGSYTGNNYNGAGLYSVSGGTLTLVASSTTSNTLWTATAVNFLSIPFSGSYAAAAGGYYIALAYNRSAETTAPQLFGGSVGDPSLVTLDLTNSNKLSGYLGTAALPSPTQVASGLTINTNIHWAALYS